MQRSTVTIRNTDLPAVEHFKECSEVLLILRCFVMDISDQRRVQQRLRFGPELITGFAIAFGVSNQCGHELQDILLGMNVRERIVMLRLFEIDCVEDSDHIRLIKWFPMFVFHGIPLCIQHRSAALQGFSAFYKDTGLGIGYDVRTVHL